jgi:hypothetical protein
MAGSYLQSCEPPPLASAVPAGGPARRAHIAASTAALPPPQRVRHRPATCATSRSFPGDRMLTLALIDRARTRRAQALRL